MAAIIIPKHDHGPDSPCNKCFTDAVYDNRLSSLLFFNRNNKHPLAYIDMTRFVKDTVIDTIQISTDTDSPYIVLKNNDGSSLSLDMSMFYTVVDDKISLSSDNAITNSAVADQINQLKKELLGFDFNVNLLSDSYDEGEFIDPTEYEEYDTVKVIDKYGTIAYYTKIDGAFVPTPRSSCAFIPTNEAMNNDIMPYSANSPLRAMLFSTDNSIDYREVKFSDDGQSDGSIARAWWVKDKIRETVSCRVHIDELKDYVTFTLLSTANVLSTMNNKYIQNGAKYITLSAIQTAGDITKSEKNGKVTLSVHIPIKAIQNDGNLKIINHGNGVYGISAASLSEYATKKWVNDNFLSSHSTLTFKQGGKYVSDFDGTADLTVNIPKELKAGKNISIGSDGSINNTLTGNSLLENDAKYITKAAIPTKVSYFINDAGYITENSIPKNVSYFNNDAKYITKADVPYAISSILTTGDISKVFDKNGQVILKVNTPKKMSSLSNDVGYITKNYLTPYATKNYVSSLNVSTFKNDVGYITKADVPYAISAIDAKGGTIKISDKNGKVTLSSALITKISQLSNDVGYLSSNLPLTITTGKFIVGADGKKQYQDVKLQYDGSKPVTIDIPKKTSSLSNDARFVTMNALEPYASKTWTLGLGVSQFRNDARYITMNALEPYATKNYVSSLGVSTFKNDAGYITSVDADYSNGILTVDNKVFDLTDLCSKYEAGNGLSLANGNTFVLTATIPEPVNALSAGVNIDIHDNIIDNTLSNLSLLSNDCGYIDDNLLSDLNLSVEANPNVGEVVSVLQEVITRFGGNLKYLFPIDIDIIDPE